MYQSLFIGNRLIRLKEVNSTNDYLKKIIAENSKEIEGLVVSVKNQIAGRGQSGNVWKSESDKNLTFSIYLKPNIFVQDQFLISKVISLGIIDFLTDIGLNHLKIKWPNDIYCNSSKISGILIENSIKGNKLNNTIVGIGLNVNQLFFDLENKPTSILKEMGGDPFDLDKLLNQLLFFIEKKYLLLKTGNVDLINKKYLQHLFRIKESKIYQINNKNIEGIIVGVDSIGKLQVCINNEIKSFDLKEIEYLI